ncbi:hypothetical protein BDZ89DRAFT_1058611 [Hymenopellis radicata]|nr:hypothetical protein BDZ89DRAFT_1058611 [Hymenopellis radicata]
MQRRRQRAETANTSFQNTKGPKPNCHGIWLGAPILEEWEWRDIQPLSIEKIAPAPAVIEDPPPTKPCRRPWLKWLPLAKPQQNPKCATTGFHPEPKFREGEGALPASVEFRIAVLVAMPSPPVCMALSSRGYMNVGVAGVLCGT